MKKAEKTETGVEELETVTFAIGEEALFCPRLGEQQTVTVAAAPAEGTTKYLCRFEDGSETPVNPCYLRKRET